MTGDTMYGALEINLATFREASLIKIAENILQVVFSKFSLFYPTNFVQKKIYKENHTKKTAISRYYQPELSVFVTDKHTLTLIRQFRFNDALLLIIGVINP